ncbi:MAG TPA: hypothetical protein VI730_03775 [Burkholderiales bacterium]|nr:hypothetical protein [Burkholderiales bacterium]
MIGGKGGDDELFGLFAMSAKVLARSGDPAAFLDWIAQHGPGLAPGMARGIDPRTGPPGLAFRAISARVARLYWHHGPLSRR